MDFMHEIRDALEDDLSLTSTEFAKLTKSTSLRVRKALSKRVRASADSKKGRGTFESDKPPVVTLVRRSDGRVRFLVHENLADVDEEIVEYGDEDDPAILCTDQYTIYDGIDESDEIDGHLAINHDEHYVVGGAHTNSCENRHSFLRN
uniref:ISH4-type transposase n=1 Tax=uncultured haloarchaeon TaxID=160804 RepID=A5YSN8_9EURY|nr:ISH4-type transposase [uncultured haloarchaeon]